MSDGVERPPREELDSRQARGVIELGMDAIDGWIARFDRNMGRVADRKEGRNREEGRGPTPR